MGEQSGFTVVRGDAEQRLPRHRSRKVDSGMAGGR